MSNPLASNGPTIERVESWIISIPTIRAHALSMATTSEQRIVLVKITTSNGDFGWGEATTIGGLAYGDESPDSIKLTIDRYFADMLIGRSILRPALAMAAINQSCVGNYFAKCAVETALLDCLGKHTEMPLSELLGGRLHDRLSVAWTLASGNTERDIAEGREMIAARRHNIFKLKIGKNHWQDDLAHVRKICDALGEQASIRVDVNQAWDLPTAQKAIPALTEAGVELVEQPMRGADHAGARELRLLGTAAIMADEALRGGVEPALAICVSRSADAISLKIAQAGGLTPCRDVARIGVAAGLSLYGGTMLEGSVGTAASAHLFSTLPNITWGTELFGPLLLTRDFLTTPLTYDDFSLVVPTGPGLGIEIDEAAVSECAET